jgi:hypothetical protein
LFLKNKNQIVIDLTPTRDDGSNGGNLLFIINLIKYIIVNVENPPIIVCSSEANNFLKEFLSLDNSDPKFKRIKFLNSYRDVINPASLKHKRINYLIHIINFTIWRVLNRISNNLNALEVKASRINLKLKQYSHTIVEKLILRINYSVANQIIKLVKQLLLLIINRKTPSKKIKNILFLPFGNFIYEANRFDRVISIIYDLQHKDLPFMFSDGEIASRDVNYSNAINFSTKVITISNFSKQRILHYYSINDESIKVIHLPPQVTKNNDSLKIKFKGSSWNLKIDKVIKKNQFFFIPGNFWNHKNQKTLLVAINMFLRVKPKFFFIFSGKLMSSFQKKEFDTFLRFNNLSKKVFILDYIDSYSIKYFYSQCLAVISASLYEGFGMVLEEANAFRKIIICSDIEAHKEICDPNASIFFNPRNPKDIFEKLIFFVHNKKKFTSNKVINCEKIYKDFLNVIVGEA